MKKHTEYYETASIECRPGVRKTASELEEEFINEFFKLQKMILKLQDKYNE